MRNESLLRRLSSSDDLGRDNTITTFNSFDDFKRLTKSLKYIKIAKGLTFEKSLDEISCPVFLERFRRNEDLILIVIGVDESLKPTIKQTFDVNKFKFDEGRPWVVQFVSRLDQSSIIFFKDQKFSYVNIIDGKLISTTPESDEEGSDKHFNELVKHLIPIILQCPRSKRSLIDVKFEPAKFSLLRDSSDLCKRFLKIFDDNSIDALERTLTENNEFTDQRRVKVLHYRDSRNYTELMIAIELGRAAFVSSLIKLEFDLSHRGIDDKTAVDLAMNHQMFDVVVELVEADSVFPKNFNIASIPSGSAAFSRLEALIEERKKLHELVASGENDKVREKCRENYGLRFCYDVNNKALLTQALEHKKFEIFSILQGAGFSRGADSTYDQILDKLDLREKNQIASMNLKTFENAPQHVISLISKSKLASKIPDRFKSFEQIWKFYNDLDQIPGVSEVLKVSALSSNLLISFDFENVDVSRMHPSQPRNTYGVFYDRGKIYIGAKLWKEDRNEVLGVIAHELSHCAMLAVYKNECLPFASKDKKRRGKFQRVSKLIEGVAFEKNFEEEIEIQLIFKYPKPEWDKELIARVPHLLAKYKDNPGRIKILKESFDTQTNSYPYAELFNFYKKVLEDMTNHLNVMQLAERINDCSELFKTIENEKIEFVKKEASKTRNSRNSENRGIDVRSGAVTDSPTSKSTTEGLFNVVCTNSPIHSLVELFQQFEEKLAMYVPIDLKFLVKQLSDEDRSLFGSKVERLLVINCADQLDGFMIETVNVLNSFAHKERIFLIVKTREREKLTLILGENNLNVSVMTYDWSKISEGYKKKIMQSEVKFQGHWLILDQLIIENGTALQFLPLNKFVGGKKLIISESPISDSEFFLERRCFTAHGESFSDIDAIINEVKQSNVAILSGIAGTGKTAVLKQVAKRLKGNFPSHWVSYVELKLHIDKFMSSSTSSFAEFATELVSSKPNKFDREIFKQMFEQGKVFLLLDGLDEICPTDKEIFLSYLTKFQAGRGNQLWVATRPRLQSELEETVGVCAFQISPFDQIEQIQFLLNCWNLNNETNQLSEQIALSFIEKLNLLIKDSESFIGIPMLLKNFAETYKYRDTRVILNNFNLYSLYKECVGRMISVWRFEKGSLSRRDQDQVDSSGSTDNVHSIHQKIALKYLLSHDIKKFKLNVSYDETVWSNELLSRIGLVRFQPKTAKPQFLHRTFAEFFLAQFVVSNLSRNQQKPQALGIFFGIIQGRREIIGQFIGSGIKEQPDFLSNVESLCLNVRQKLNDKVNWELVFSVISRYFNEQVFETAMKVISDENFKKIVPSNDWKGEILYYEIRMQKNDVKRKRFSDRVKTVFNHLELEETLKRIRLVHRNMFLGRSKHDFGKLSSLVERLNQVIGQNEVKMLLKESDENGSNIVSLAAVNFDASFFKQLFEILSKFLSNEEISDLVLSANSKHDHFNLTTAIGDLSFFVALLEILKTFMTIDQQRQMWQVRGNKGRNIFLCACSRLFQRQTLLLMTDAVKEVLTDDEIKLMLKEKDISGNNIVILAAKSCYRQIFEELLPILKRYLSCDDISDLMFGTNDEGKNCLQYAAKFSSPPTLKAMIELVGTLLPIEKSKEFWKMQNHEGRNVFLVACSRLYQRGNFSILVRKAEQVLSEVEIKLLLLEKDKHGSNIVQLAASLTNEHIVLDVFSVLKNFLNNEELSDLLLHVNIKGDNCLHLALRFSAPKTLKLLLGCGKTFLNLNQQAELWKSHDSEHRNVFLSACMNDFRCKEKPIRSNISTPADVEIFSLLTESIQEVLPDKDVKSMLEESDMSGSNLMLLAATLTDDYVLSDLLSTLRKFLSPNKIGGLIFRTNNKGEHCFHQDFCSPTIFKTLLEFVKMFLTGDEQVSFWKMRDAKNQNVLIRMHQEPAFYYLENVSFLVEVVENVLTDDDIKSMLVEKDKFGTNILLLAAKLTDECAFPDLFSILKKYLTDEDIRDLLLDVDYKGDNCLHLAAVSCSLKFLLSLTETVRKVLTREQCKKFWKMRNYQHENIFLHAGSKFLQSETATILVEEAKQSLTEGEIRSMLKERDKYGSSIVSIATDVANECVLTDLFFVLKKFLSNDEINELKSVPVFPENLE